MMRSLSSAVAGLRSHQTKMDVIGNNIANVNTYGFKASRTTFADVYYQNLSSGSAGSANSGGTNPTQIGYGASVATVDVINTQSGSASTDRALDVYITGDGFLVSKDASGKFQYTRLGNLGFDAMGNLIDGNGQLIQGFPLNPDGTPKISADGTILGDQLQNIKVDTELLDKLTSISISSSGAIVGQLPGDSELTVSSGLPAWLNSLKITLPAESTYQGPVNLAISGFCRKEDMASILGIQPDDILSMEMGTLKLPAGSDYTISVDNAGLVTISRPGSITESAINLTGSVKSGKLTLMDSSGNVGMVINVDTTKEISLRPTSAKVPVYGATATPDTLVDKGVGDVGVSSKTTMPGIPNTQMADPGDGSFVPFFVQDSSGVLQPGAGDPYVKTTTIDTGIKLYKSPDNTPLIVNGKQLYAELMVDPADTTCTAIGYPVVPHYDASTTPATYLTDVVSTVYDTGHKLIGKDGLQLRDGNGNPLFVQILNGTNQMALQYDATGRKVTAEGTTTPTYVTILPEPTPEDKQKVPLRGPGGAIVVPNRWVDHAQTGERDEIVGRPFTLDLYQQMSTTDKGGNSVKVPAEPQIFSVPSDFPHTMTFGDVTIELMGIPTAFNGTIGTAGAAEGERLAIGNLVLAKFRNPGGLQQSGTSYFDETFNSGSAVFVMPGVEGTGTLKAGYLEMSNVDVSKEFTDMITTQRGFQANTRIITVSDEMLQELVNLKR